MVTVTCLVRAIEKSGDCSVVRANGDDPKATPRLFNLRGDGRSRRAGGPMPRIPRRSIVHYMPTNDRYKGVPPEDRVIGSSGDPVI
jgi:hypothetical protein